MARKLEDSTTADGTPVMAVGDLIGRVVRTESGERIGVIRGLETDDDGRIMALQVRDRWLLGQQQVVPTSGMHIEDGDVFVPGGSSRPSTYRGREHEYDGERERGHDHDHHDVADHDRVHTASARVAPQRSMVMLAGREGARGRFGGLDLLSSLFGGLVTISSLLIIGGILAAAFGLDPFELDTSISSASDLFTQPYVVAGVAGLLAAFIGGWATGRSARFDGVGNALMSVVWVLAIAVGLGALTAWIGEEYDVFTTAGLPSVLNDELAFWGVIALVGYVALMLIGAALGGALGESWHRRADRAMLDVVTTADDRSADAVIERDVPSERRIHE